MKNQLFRLITAVAISAGMFSCSSGKYYMFSSKPAETRTVAQAAAPEIVEQEAAMADVSASASTDLTPAPAASTVSLAKAARPAAKTNATSVAAMIVEKAAADKIAISPKKLAKLEKKIEKANQAAADGKSQVIALVLCALVGALGIHRFYLGYIGIGIIQLLTLGGCGIWALIDLIRIITGDLQPKDGSYDKTL